MPTVYSSYHDGSQLNLSHINSKLSYMEQGINFRDYYHNVEWDIMKAPGKRNMKIYSCCKVPYYDITYQIVLRRKTLFYTVNLIIPCVSISLLTIFVFYLPSESREKISLCISIFLALTVFVLLLADLIPSTSLIVPLLGKYLLFTMILVTLSILCTIIVLTIHYRDPKLNELPSYVRYIFIDTLPKYLLLEKPLTKTDLITRTSQKKVKRSTEQRKHSPLFIRKKNIAYDDVELNEFEQSDEIFVNGFFNQLHTLQKLLTNDLINNTTERFTTQMQHDRVAQEWKYVALVVDRIFLILFTFVSIVGTLFIFLKAPTLYDSRVSTVDLTNIDQGVNNSCTYVH
ncbi:unnamed protein product [Didymodactylos carnosus]|uniref:Uncharacterized protein n=1 Tax=Didymodactylos carnosus TaxID=1234261 RepID=A0A814SS84_9BILA|nr:unnamed protein product [Didymodactylos carnosus]CAF3912042.1 unnamed protein product [Didymodactylos carnosus]